jgi:DNA-binding NarL/FixJ family response regulator
MAQIAALVDDLFFQAKIMETAKQSGVQLKTFGTGAALVAEVLQTPPRLVIIDLNARHGPLEAIEHLHASAEAVPIVAFLSHVQTELAARAKAAGCRDVMPRSQFTMNLAKILTSAQAPDHANDHADVPQR